MFKTICLVALQSYIIIIIYMELDVLYHHLVGKVRAYEATNFFAPDFDLPELKQEERPIVPQSAILTRLASHGGIALPEAVLPYLSTAKLTFFGHYAVLLIPRCALLVVNFFHHFDACSFSSLLYVTTLNAVVHTVEYFHFSHMHTLLSSSRNDTKSVQARETMLHIMIYNALVFIFLFLFRIVQFFWHSKKRGPKLGKPSLLKVTGAALLLGSCLGSTWLDAKPLLRGAATDLSAAASLAFLPGAGAQGAYVLFYCWAFVLTVRIFLALALTMHLHTRAACTAMLYITLITEVCMGIPLLLLQDYGSRLGNAGYYQGNIAYFTILLVFSLLFR